MKKFLKFGCLSIILLFVIVTVLAFIFGEEPDDNTPVTANNKASNAEAVTENNEKVISDVVIDASKFSRISSEELIQIMGEPDSIEDFPWKVPKTGESMVGKLYSYENNKFEFIVLDDAVVRLNVYSGKWIGHSDEVFSFENEESIFSSFGINPSENLKKVVDNKINLRFSPVSDKVAEVLISEIKDNTFELVKITYNLNYF